MPSSKIARKIPNLEDFIVTIPGVFSPETCDDLIEEYKDWTKPALVEGNQQHESRTCEQIVVQPRDHIDEGLVKAILEYKKTYPLLKVSGICNTIFLKYEKGQFYKQHVDSFPKHPRAVTISVALNDDFLGGEWAWFDKSVIRRFNKGDAVLFPSNFMFPHEILEVTDGTRYALITWFTE